MDIDDFKLELVALQKKDMEDAKNLGIKDKDNWFRYIINADKDSVAEGVLNLAKRYNIEDNVVAYYFDPTMLIRISKIKESNKKITI